MGGNIKKILFFTFLYLFIQNAALASNFPSSPDRRLTPGTFCKNPDSHRYREKIPYCRRNVSQQEKIKIIADYNKKLGYNINLKERNQYKIDHLIPLCAGGSNEPQNLWPQHESIYQHTDPVEQLACEKMADGKLFQRQAVEFIYKVKLDIREAPAVVELLMAM